MKKEFIIYLIIQGVMILICIISYLAYNAYNAKTDINYPVTQESLTLNKELLKLIKTQQIVIKEQAGLIKAYEEALIYKPALILSEEGTRMNKQQKNYIFGNIIKLLKKLNLPHDLYIKEKESFYNYIYGKKEN